MTLPTRTRSAALATGVLALSVAAVAWAAPNRNTTLSATVTKYEYDGGPITGTPINDVTVDDTLIKLDGPGALTIKATDFSNPDVNDLDLNVYKADAAGEPVGEPIAEGAEGGEENVSVKNLQPGFILVRVYAFTGVEATFKGALTFTPSGAAPAGPPAPGATPPPGTTPPPATPASADLPPDATIGKLAKSAKVKKVKKFSGTATDDKGVAAVEIALVKKGKTCSQMTASGKFAAVAKCDGPTSYLKATGTTKWSFKLKKKLKKGNYVVFARAMDSAGQKQGGFTAKNKKAFKVK